MNAFVYSAPAIAPRKVAKAFIFFSLRGKGCSPISKLYIHYFNFFLIKSLISEKQFGWNILELRNRANSVSETFSYAITFLYKDIEMIYYNLVLIQIPVPS